MIKVAENVDIYRRYYMQMKSFELRKFNIRSSINVSSIVPSSSKCTQLVGGPTEGTYITPESRNPLAELSS